METTLTQPKILETHRQKKFAEIRLRLMAFLIDSIIYCCAAGLLLYFFFSTETQPIAGETPTPLLENLTEGILFLAARPELVVVLFVFHWLYFAIAESSARQATPGKNAFRLQVTCTGGRRVSFFRATVRYFSKVLLALPALAGIWASFFSVKKQMLHDKISSCLVITQ